MKRALLFPLTLGLRGSAHAAPNKKARTMRLTKLLIALCAVSLPAAAIAQSAPPPDSQGGNRRQRQNAQNQAPAAPVDLASLYRGVACQAGADAASLEAMLATAPYSAQEREQAAAILRLVQRCQRGTGGMSANTVTLRGVIAETLLESRFPAAQAARSPAAAAAPLLDVTAATTRPDAASLASAYALIQCTAERHGDAVRTFLASDPGTPAEQAAFGVLNPSLASCATGSTNLNVDMRTLRGALAESLYRWSVVQRDGASAPYAARQP